MYAGSIASGIVGGTGDDGGGLGGCWRGEEGGTPIDSRAFALVRTHFVFIYSSMCNSCVRAVLAPPLRSSIKCAYVVQGSE